MITGEDVQRCKEEKQGVKLVVVDTMQFFEFEIPETMDPEEFVDSDTCRMECAMRIMNQTTDLIIDRVCTQYDTENEMWHDI